jgi:hypothetical protein
MLFHAPATQTAHTQDQLRSRQLTWPEKPFQRYLISTVLESMDKRTLSGGECSMVRGSSNDNLRRESRNSSPLHLSVCSAPEVLNPHFTGD